MLGHLLLAQGLSWLNTSDTGAQVGLAWQCPSLKSQKGWNSGMILAPACQASGCQDLSRFAVASGRRQEMDEVSPRATRVCSIENSSIWSAAGIRGRLFVWKTELPVLPSMTRPAGCFKTRIVCLRLRSSILFARKPQNALTR